MFSSDHAVDAVLAELARRGISIEIVGDRLKLSPGDRLSESDIERLRAMKPQLMARLKCQHQHHMPKWWRPETNPSRYPGRLRVTCCNCGRFIGYRLEPSRN